MEAIKQHEALKALRESGAISHQEFSKLTQECAVESMLARINHPKKKHGYEKHADLIAGKQKTTNK